MIRKFPDNFMFGTAMSPFQVEMGKSKDSISSESDWYSWVHSESIIKKTYVSGDFPDNGPDFWNDYKKYVDYAVSLGNNAIRIGIDWARVFKKTTENIKVLTVTNEKGDVYEMEFPVEFMVQMDDIVDASSVAHYKEILAYIKSKGLKLVLTAYHWPLPLWLHDPVQCNENFMESSSKGWADKKTVVEFGKYVYYIYKKFKEYVDIWHTINEPNIIAINGYLYGNLEGFPPGMSDFKITVTVLRNLAYAHNIAYKIIKMENPATTVGINVAVPYFQPELDTPQNRFINEYVSYVFYKLYLDSALYGNFDPSLSGIYSESRPEEFSGTDFIGIDYYSRIIVRYLDNDNVDIRYRFSFLPCKVCSDNYMDIFPEGIRAVTVSLFNRYRKPVIILENGVADATGKIRTEFIEKHLIELHRAIKEDFVPIRGYFYRSLMDNYEWARGYRDRFGLYTGSNDEYEATEAARYYSKICHEMGIFDEKYREY